MLTTNKSLKEAANDPVKMTYVQRNILKSKPQFFEWYKTIYQYMVRHKTNGDKNVEIGSGSSFLSEFMPGLIKTNILHIKFNDLTYNAYDIPFKDKMIDNIILIDVLHHFDSPMKFFKEAQRVLRDGGRILICDPYISLFSYFLWKYVHPENCDLTRFGYESSGRHNPLLCANSASLTLLFGKKLAHFKKRFPGLKIVRKDYHTIMHYWLAGGYNFPSFIPQGLGNFMKWLEGILSPLGYFLASFGFVVIEKED